MKPLSRFIYMLIILLLYSCEYEAQISYKVSNDLSENIKVVFNDNGKDITIVVDSKKTATIAVHGQGLSSVDNYKESSTQLSEFIILDIYKKDTIKSKTDYMKTENWTWHENDVHNAEYTTIVNNSDFEK